MATSDGERRACCMVSEMLQEAGLDRDSARTLRRQVLQGLVMLCQWQLERMDETDRSRQRDEPSDHAPRSRKGRGPRKVVIE